jgi:hypothetical protein
MDSPNSFRAVFGYNYVAGDAVQTNEPYALSHRTDANWLVFSHRADDDNDNVSAEQVQPEVFFANTMRMRVFEVALAHPDEQVQWHVRCCGGNDDATTTTTTTTTATQVAIADRFSTPLCTSDSSYTLEPVQPLLERCTYDAAAHMCDITFGYHNPNLQTVQLDVGEHSNALRMANTTAIDHRQPRVFFRGLVRDAVSLRVVCNADAAATTTNTPLVEWGLSTGTVAFAARYARLLDVRQQCT